MRPAVAALAFAITGMHLGVLVMLSANGTKEPAPSEPTKPRIDFMVSLDERPIHRAAQPRRKEEMPAPRRAEAVRPLFEPPAARTAPPTPITQQPRAGPDYGRWTVVPSAAPPPPSPATGLPGCTLQTLPTLTGAAHDVCAKRLSEMARNAPPLSPPIDKRDEAERAYAQALKSWKTSTVMSPHPCAPQNEPAHKLYFDKCSLANAARNNRGQGAAVKLEFKYKF